ncbi:MAG: glycosyltransferase [Myxococcota bacterium]
MGEDRSGCDPVIVVVPCFNEARRLDPGAFRDFAASRDWLRLVFVDDGSQDGTQGLLEDLVKEPHGRLELLPLPHNVGKAEAVRQGILHGLEAGAASVGFWDADLATPLEEMDRLREALRTRPRLEVVIGSRVRLLGHRIERHIWRHYFGRVAATLVSRLLTLPVYDTQCGAKLFRVCPGVRDAFRTPFATRWEFDVEVLARWLLRHRSEGQRDVDLRILEMPLERWRDVADSRMTPADFFRSPLDLARLWRRYARPLRQPARHRVAGPEPGAGR